MDMPKPEIVDKLEQMLGSYAPHPEGQPYTKLFQEEESPSGMLARSGAYNVRSRVIDDDGEIYAGEYTLPFWLFCRNCVPFLPFRASMGGFVPARGWARESSPNTQEMIVFFRMTEVYCRKQRSMHCV